jgi:hypothetical protein
MHKEIKDAAFYPILRLVLSSEFLWSHGYIQAKEITEKFLNNICAYEKIQVSRCDLTADFEGGCPQITLDQFVTAARSKDLIGGIHNKGHYLTGYTVGGRAIHLDIYDKTFEIKHKSHKEWFYDPWRLNGWDGESPVTRYEYRIRREALKEMHIETWDDLYSNLGGLWNYCTNDWLTVRDIGERGGRRTRSWAICEWWKRVQEVAFGDVTNIVRDRVRKCHIDNLLKSFQGYGKTIGAYQYHQMRQTPELAIYMLKRKVNQYFDTDEFKEAMIARSIRVSEINISTEV